MTSARDRAFAAAFSLAAAAFGGSVLVLVGCSSPSPTAPDVAPAAGVTNQSPDRGPAALAAESVKLTTHFDLLDGSFVLATADGSTLSGAYTGTATVAAAETAELVLDVTAGTGAFDGASGSLKGDGTGSFVGEGRFSLSLKGSFRIAGAPGSVPIRAELSGQSVASCTTSGVIRLTLQAVGATPKNGTVTASMQHGVSNTSCQ